MPLVESTYRAPFGFSNGHVQTIFAQLRRVRAVNYRRERIETPDADFLDLDWVESGFPRLAILSHGLEGNSLRHYVLGMVQALQRHQWDALAWNYRGCSGEPNRKLRWYHSGDSADLEAVVQHSANKGYTEIALIGFSLGGNITLKYIGERGPAISGLISRAVTFSVPCDLRSSAIKLAKRSNSIYMKRFLKMLREKIRLKMDLGHAGIDDQNFDEIRTFFQFDNRYTAPIHGFRDAEDYFAKSSSRQFLTAIRIPTLLVNAKNDPFLDSESFPYPEAEASKHFYFESPASGGHMGFLTFHHNGEYWSETRAISFLQNPPLSAPSVTPQ